MNLLTILTMIANGHEERVAIGRRVDGLSYAELADRALRIGERMAAEDARSLVFVAENGPAYPVALFGAAAAHAVFLPLNYRLSSDRIADAIGKQDRPWVVTDTPGLVPAGEAVRVLGPLELLYLSLEGPVPAWPTEPQSDDIAVLLQTSGTTSAPKSAVLRHQHLTSYLMNATDFASAEPGDTMVVSVPPYHIAAVANLLSNLYSGRRIIYLQNFIAAEWLDTVRAEEVTHAMVVPTMLARIVNELDAQGLAGPPSLQAISYGGSRISPTVLARALELFPRAGFVNAYGLTETSSSIAVFGPEDHRAALGSDDPTVQARLGSVGRPIPGVEIEIRHADGMPCTAGEAGEVWVRGAQVSGEYLESGALLDGDGWFHTRDRGSLDGDGYLFIEGRADDTVIRGGENIAPAEIEEAIQGHPAVLDAAVVGVPDDEWGQRIGAVVVRRAGAAISEDEVREWVRGRLRSSKTPDAVVIQDEPLPETATGKVLRRALVDLFRAPAHN
ncbi:class I adenylate-forming enzyme family protein [Nocardioides sp.]|uniref:class I adenylate-forming enzyme family protein n=1 Tax=Nocardioides sp. TaxID=35761 RepID=UPI002737038A|nr:class I adenylate-forming enzyme family protein [Nocardioides sp.]MDP3894557.1 class I adenylate-forming enzyme family protein [Nocardioides sp.]